MVNTDKRLTKEDFNKSVSEAYEKGVFGADIDFQIIWEFCEKYANQRAVEVLEELKTHFKSGFMEHLEPGMHLAVMNIEGEIKQLNQENK